MMKLINGNASREWEAERDGENRRWFWTGVFAGVVSSATLWLGARVARWIGGV